MHRLVRVTSDDYRDFRRAYSKIEYSFFKKGEEQPSITKAVREMTQGTIKTKMEFLEEVNNPNNELYFFEVDGEIQGIVELIFCKKECNIYQFAVFEHLKGLGTTFYQEVLNIIKEHKSKKITLWCPYEGSQMFWLKNGFYPKYGGFFQKKI